MRRIASSVRPANAVVAALFVLLSPGVRAQPKVSAGQTLEACVPLVVTASSGYTAGNEVGQLIGLLKLPAQQQYQGPWSGILESVRITSKSVQTAELDVTFFTGSPSNSTWTDKVTPSINLADVGLPKTVIKLTSTFSGLGTHTLYWQDSIASAIIVNGATLYAVVTTPGTPTFNATSDLTLCATVLQDNMAP